MTTPAETFPLTVETAWKSLMTQLAITNVNTITAQRNALRLVHRTWGIR